MQIGISIDLTGARRRNFSPKNLPGLSLWLRADLGITLNGSNVSAWANQAANQYHFSQATASKQPLFVSSSINGRPALEFDGTDDIMGTTGFSIGSSAEFFIIFRLDNDPPIVNLGGLEEFCSHISSNEDWVPFAPDGKIYCGIFATLRKSTNVAKGAGYFTSPRILSVYSALNDWRMYLNGGLEYSTTSSSVGTTSAPSIGGDPETVEAKLDGVIAEVIAYSPALSDANRTKVIDYLKKRYGIS